MNLECKIYLNKELATWMGISPITFSNNKEKKLMELSYYCEFEEVGKRIKVTKVLDPIYSKAKHANYTKVQKAMKDLWGSGKGKYGLDTDRNVAKKIEQIKEQYEITTKESSNASYCGKERRTNSAFCWNWQLAKYVVGGNGIKVYLPFTEEELEKKKKIYSEIFNKQECQELQEQDQLNYEAYAAGEITKEEFADTAITIKKQTICYWVEYKQKVAEMCNCEVERCANISLGAF